MIKKLLVLTLFFGFIFNLTAQSTNNTWQIGVGFSGVKFGKEDATFIGDQYLFQVPRLNATIPLNNRFSVDGALSFGTIDNVGLIKNAVKYLSLDGSLRYNFKTKATINSYVFVGGSLVDSERKMTPTINAGAGVTYWISKKWGVNTQIYYKHSLEIYSSMRSHIQGTLSVLYSFNWNNLFGSGSSKGKCI